jgi:hypothetical protein
MYLVIKIRESFCSMHSFLPIRYEWMFIKDTLDIANHALEESQHALMDQLGKKISTDDCQVSAYYFK